VAGESIAGDRINHQANRNPDCATLRNMPTKKTKTHTSVSKKSAALSSSSKRAKKVTSKRSESVRKFERPKKMSEAWLKKKQELTLKVFQMVYEDYQQGKFRRIL
jgi:hypothetical protein